ncbi:hypothetical protein Arub01_17070 [Actinomadura rubrobrunea]|uniref:Uncharacterized protein n=1 Tax=Actinomadura rubrobrunea TaxID=115335 RepID=A0A9W6PUW9_9ACTN|nr:hypothetical protein Arub01_17070 [Actinomadura rubrobrunea]
MRLLDRPGAILSAFTWAIDCHVADPFDYRSGTLFAVGRLQAGAGECTRAYLSGLLADLTPFRSGPRRDLLIHVEPSHSPGNRSRTSVRRWQSAPLACLRPKKRPDD